jgi:hypothetical protein
MGHIKNVKLYISLLMLFCSIWSYAQDRFYINDENYYQYFLKNDSTIELRLAINGIPHSEDFYTEDGIEGYMCPRFKGIYKDSFIFMIGYGQYYRNVIVFYPKNEVIVRNDFENELCLKSKRKETYLFFYEDNPVKIEYYFKNDRIRFKKIRSKHKYRKDDVISLCD